VDEYVASHYGRGIANDRLAQGESARAPG